MKANKIKVLVLTGALLLTSTGSARAQRSPWFQVGKLISSPTKPGPVIKVITSKEVILTNSWSRAGRLISSPTKPAPVTKVITSREVILTNSPIFPLQDAAPATQTSKNGAIPTFSPIVSMQDAVPWAITPARDEKFIDVSTISTNPSIPPAIQRIFEELDRAGEFLPQFVLGDVNEDGAVDIIDVGLIEQMLELGGSNVAGLTCPAAGDITGDGEIGFDDLEAYSLLINGALKFDNTDQPVSHPLLSTQPSMPCELTNIFFAATPAALPGETASIFFLDEGLDVSNVVLTVLMGQVEIIPSVVGFGFDIITSPGMLPGENVILQMGIPGRGYFLYALPILPPLFEFPLAAFGGGDDDDDDDGDNKGDKKGYDVGNNDDDDDGDDPRDTPPPTIYGEEDEGDMCPLKDDGCEALVIDFFKNGAFYDYSMETDVKIVPQLKSIGCNVELVEPKFLRAPIFGNLFSGYAKKNVNDNNKSQWDKIDKAIDRHAKKLASGRALGIQIILGHADESGWGVAFAAPSGEFLGANSRLPRTGLHGKIYKAEFSPDEFRVCGNVALDYSCNSGFTPIIIQSLNNSGNASKAIAKPDNHKLHAGYDLDVGRGESEKGSKVKQKVLQDQVKELASVIEAEIKLRKGENPVSPRFKRFREGLKDYSKKGVAIHRVGGIGRVVKKTYYIDNGVDDVIHNERLK